MRRRGNTLAATLVVVVIMLLLATVFLFGGFGKKGSGATAGQGQASRADGLGTTIPGAVRYKAKDTECQSDLEQVRQFLAVHASSGEDDKPPASLDELQIPKSLLYCPIGKEAYVYDPQTGKVHCPHPGHENF